jgi:3-dehydroquinate synthase
MRRTAMSATRIEVALGARSYPVLIEPGLLDRAGSLVASYARDERLVVISDERVWALQGERLIAGFATAGVEALAILLPPGEATKSWDVLSTLLDRLLAHDVERGDHIVAFGGGVIGDLAGFAAAILKRGCGLVQIPTTLLAQVDASVGGKTAINVAAGKNLVGALHQPSLVLIDPVCLHTLPPRELRGGYAEIVKYGLLGDEPFFAWCEANGEALIEGDVGARAHAIAKCVAAKAAIVAADERESTGQRALLNLGHTFAHALEAETGFTMLHGEAVALGLTLAFRLSAERGACPERDAVRVEAHFAAVGLPSSLSDAGIAVAGEAIAAHMLRDKKTQGGRLTFILVRGIGEAFVERGVTADEVAAFLDSQREPVRA